MSAMRNRWITPIRQFSCVPAFKRLFHDSGAARRLSGRTVLTLLFILCLSATGAAAKQRLRVLAWPGYADDDVVQGFERRHDVEVEIRFVTSDDELWTRVNHPEGANFDLFAVNTAELQRYIDAGLLRPIDTSLIPNMGNQLPRFRDLEKIPGATRNHRAYAIPYTYSEMGLIYNRKLVDTPPRSLTALWDPAYQGRVLAFDTSNHNFTLAGLLEGAADPFRLTDEEFRRAVDRLIALRRNVLTFYSSPEEAVELMQQNPIALLFANYGSQQLKQLERIGADIGYLIPEEGALAWLDCWAITRASTANGLAEKWIDYMLDREVSKLLTERQGLANTIDEGSSRTLASDRIIWLRPLANPERRAELWSRIRSGDVQVRLPGQ